MSQGKELGVGLVILIGITVAVLGTFWLQGTRFGALTTVDVLTASVGQLQEGNVVTFRGVRIGQVDRIRVEPSTVAVRVTLLLDQDMTLPEDAGVVLGPESLFGDWQAEIASRSAFPDFPFFEVGPAVSGEPPVLGGYALPELSRLTASAEQISQNLADLTDRMELAFNQETADNLSRAIGNIEAITQEVRLLVRQQGEAATGIASSADSALAEVGIAAQAARRSFEHMEGLTSGPRVDSILQDIEVASSGLRRITDQLADSTTGLAVTLAHADSAFMRLDRVAASLEAGEGSLGRLLVDTTFVVRAEGLLFQLDLLLRDVRENPRRYVRLSIF
jgi:phospholipid/cholesterol/gamma-HCH transport system substrate-binding protein